MPTIYKVTASEPTADLEFVMSDDSVDRMGDVIEPEGWELATFRKNPIALFGHSGSFPIGKWSNVRVEAGKLIGKLNLAKRGTSQRIDELISLVEQGILRAVSVGFMPIEREALDKDDPFGGQRFIKQELLETSLVSVPANPNAMQLARSLNISSETMELVFGEHATQTRAITTTGGHASDHKSGKKKPMPNLSERVQDAQADVNAKKDKVQQLSTAETVDLDALTEANVQLESAEALLKGLKASERALAISTLSAAPSLPVAAPPTIGRRPLGVPVKELEKGALVMRSIVAKLLAHCDVHKRPAIFHLGDRYGVDGEIDEQSRAVFDIVTRSVTAPADTTTSGWASQLVETQIAGFMQALIPMSVYPGLSSRGLRLNFGRSGIISIPTRTATTAISGAFIAQGAPIPVKQGLFTSVPMTPKKMAVISTFTREISEHSTPAIETLIRDAMAEDTSVALDVVLLGSAAADTTTPAGLRNGVAAITATAGGGFTALVGDLKALLGALVTGTNGNLRSPVWIMNPVQALAISVTQNAGGDFPFQSEINGGRFMGYPVIQSGTVTAGMVILVDAADFVSVEGDAPRFDVSDQATLHMETAPVAIGTVGSPNVVAAPTRSLWQTDTLGIRMIMDVNWILRRSGVIAWTQAVTW